MKTNWASVSEKYLEAVAPLKRYPLVYRGLGLVLALALYLAGLVLVDAVSGDARLPLALTAVYFLPAVLRAWLLFYWAARDEVLALKARRGQTHA